MAHDEWGAFAERMLVLQHLIPQAQRFTFRMVDFPESPDPNSSTLRRVLASMLNSGITSTHLNLWGQLLLRLISYRTVSTKDWLKILAYMRRGSVKLDAHLLQGLLRFSMPTLVLVGHLDRSRWHTVAHPSCKMAIWMTVLDMAISLVVWEKMWIDKKRGYKSRVGEPELMEWNRGERTRRANSRYNIDCCRTECGWKLRNTNMMLRIRKGIREQERKNTVWDSVWRTIGGRSPSHRYGSSSPPHSRDNDPISHNNHFLNFFSQQTSISGRRIVRVPGRSQSAPPCRLA